MKHIYQVSGMTCQGCVASVKEKLAKVDGVEAVEIDLDNGEVEISMQSNISLTQFKEVLPQKYDIIESINSHILGNEKKKILEEKTKLQQLRPLLLIFSYLFAAAFLLNYQDSNTGEAMLDFMGLFYIVFSFFKFLDLKGFPESFKMYDPLAKMLPVYGWIYPFLELVLGLLFLMRFQIKTALIITIIILGITTIGVVKVLLDKKKIQCACLGTALKLPMTQATFIENTIMLAMAITMLFFSI
jgi:copper chaperone CopZ